MLQLKETIKTYKLNAEIILSIHQNQSVGSMQLQRRFHESSLGMEGENRRCHAHNYVLHQALPKLVSTSRLYFPIQFPTVERHTQSKRSIHNYKLYRN